MMPLIRPLALGLCAALLVGPALPAADAPPVPGSVGRLLTRGEGGWLWDGQPIVPAELER